ncbi:YciI family protein [Marinicaulis aureus]|uniref:YciI family protein n=1 Tax=Hyphococcus aureus TaxID=2666033 RepID=A0ABW1KXT6_9PROT
MRVMILAHESPGDFAQRDDQEKSATYMGEWYAYSGAMKEAGVMLKGAALEQPSTATVVSVRNGVRKVEDGPFPDTKEQLGGFFVIEAPDMTKAVEWASKCPSEKTGFVDVRAIPDYGQDE